MSVIKVLYEGYSKQNTDGSMTANCTCTLINNRGVIIVIDTMTAWDKHKILNALKEQNVSPEEVNYVVCTHSHADHIGNNNLFTNAEHIVGSSSVNINDMFFDKNIKDEPYKICDGVKVVATPGHTYEDVSVLLEIKEENKLTNYAVVGDLFEKEEDIANPKIWQDLGTPELQEVQAKMRWDILNNVDYIIPGHGPMFRVTSNMKEFMGKQLQDRNISTEVSPL